MSKGKLAWGCLHATTTRTGGGGCIPRTLTKPDPWQPIVGHLTLGTRVGVCRVKQETIRCTPVPHYHPIERGHVGLHRSGDKLCLHPNEWAPQKNWFGPDGSQGGLVLLPSGGISMLQDVLVCRRPAATGRSSARWGVNRFMGGRLVFLRGRWGGTWRLGFAPALLVYNNNVTLSSSCGCIEKKIKKA